VFFLVQPVSVETIPDASALIEIYDATHDSVPLDILGTPTKHATVSSHLDQTPPELSVLLLERSKV
jgi:hypothetical protein